MTPREFHDWSNAFPIDTALEQLATIRDLWRDAERYRWLRQLRKAHDGTPFIARYFCGAFSQWVDENADQAIDAAMAVSETASEQKP
jgi:hypothetical protein